MRRRFVITAVMLAALAAATPARAQLTENAIGDVTVSGTQVRIQTSTVAQPRWFGVRVFTVPSGTMLSHNVLRTSNTAFGTPESDGKLLCVSDFQGTGSPTGGLAGPASALTAPADQPISMLGGFVGAGTGCSDGSTGDLLVNMNTTGPILQAFYGAFYGDSAAQWRGQVASTTGNTSWWNIWGNFTSLGFGSS